MHAACLVSKAVLAPLSCALRAFNASCMLFLIRCPWPPQLHVACMFHACCRQAMMHTRMRTKVDSMLKSLSLRDGELLKQASGFPYVASLGMSQQSRRKVDGMMTTSNFWQKGRIQKLERVNLLRVLYLRRRGPSRCCYPRLHAWYFMGHVTRSGWQPGSQ